MKIKLLVLIMAMVMFSMGLTACGATNNQEQPEEIIYEPTRYNDDNQGDQDILNNQRNRGNGNYQNNINGDDRMRNNNEPDTPFNMDEEEPDLDEEPSEERNNRD